MSDEGLIEKPESAVRNDNAKGRSGTLVISSQIQSDYISDLNGVSGQETYEKMTMSDSQIRKVYHAVNNPLKSAKWDIEPASDDEKDIKAAALMKQILFNDVPRGWKGKLDEILTFPWYGHSVFEIVHENKTTKSFGAYTGLKNISFRAQKTLEKWIFDKDGTLTAIQQKQSGDIEVDVEMPANTLLIFYNERLGSNSGYPFCRMLYGNYKRKLLYKTLQAIGIERSAIASPYLELPKDLLASSPEYALAEAQLKAYTLAEDASFMVPYGYKLNFNTSAGFDPSKVQSAIKAENEEIVGAVVGMFLEMGIGGNSGNQAGTSVSSRVFTNGIQYLADKVCDVMNLELIPNLMALNFGDTFEVLPKMTCSGITEEDGKVLMEIITGFVEKGVITVDEQLEDFVRKSNNLPKKAEGEVLDNKKTKDAPGTEDPATPTKDTKPVAVEKETTLNLKEFYFAAKSNDVPDLIESQAEKIDKVIKDSVRFSGAKMIADVVNRYKQLPTAKKQDATTVTLGGQAKFRDALKKVLNETTSLSIAMAKKEVGLPELQLSSKDSQIIRIKEKYDIEEIKLSSDLEKYPTHVQLLISKQTQMIQEQTLAQMQAAVGFSFSSIERKSSDIDVIKQNMEESLDDLVNKITIKADDVSALMVNEGREAVFFDDDVIEMIHSYTFMNGDPKSPICRALAGTTFNTNDAESLRYSPPLHHGCNSYLRANLKTSKGIEKLKVSTLSPTPEQVKSITL